MKALPFKIPRISNESMMVQEDKQPYLYDSLHMHPEIQITYILEGKGTAYVGDHIGNFGPDEIFIIGPNVPHVFKNDEDYYNSETDLYAHAITIFIDKEYLNQTLFKLPEAYEFMTLISQMSKCLKAQNQEALRAGFKKVSELKGLDKMIEVLQITRTLNRDVSFHFLMHNEVIMKVSEDDGRRLNDIVHFTLNNYKRHITLEEVASIASMTVPSFCRFFKQRTRKTYISFITELRINQACKLLPNKDNSVLQVAILTGYNNLSNFNRQFKKVTGVTPTEFKSTN